MIIGTGDYLEEWPDAVGVWALISACLEQGDTLDGWDFDTVNPILSLEVLDSMRPELSIEENSKFLIHEFAKQGMPSIDMMRQAVSLIEEYNQKATPDNVGRCPPGLFSNP
ncbi:Uncharacterised protein [BD1-7 clade bacterium]|uniref:Uncharacterized protein n=1 Tax=BD1-7 clade bacterium TaxID=2029982 RepID=A0A5S9QYP6_9GAMM|nr:Uncharacterised protein [BD1-7 clade bacterium]